VAQKLLDVCTYGQASQLYTMGSEFADVYVHAAPRRLSVGHCSRFAKRTACTHRLGNARLFLFH
jgi:hypothetical protein